MTVSLDCVFTRLTLSTVIPWSIFNIPTSFTVLALLFNSMITCYLQISPTSNIWRFPSIRNYNVHCRALLSPFRPYFKCLAFLHTKTRDTTWQSQVLHGTPLKIVIIILITKDCEEYYYLKSLKINWCILLQSHDLHFVKMTETAVL